MRLNKTMKKSLAVVLSMAMVATSTTFYSTTAKAATLDEMVASTEYNLALNKKSTPYPGVVEGNIANINNGVFGGIGQQAAISYSGWGYAGESYVVIDLGDYYDASTLDQVVIQYKDEAENDTVITRGYAIQYSVDGINYTTVAETAVVAALDENRCTTDDVSGATGAVRYVRAYYPKTADFGMQITEFAVLDTDLNAATVEVEKCDDAAGVAVVSDDFNSITYSITAGENQEDYVYMVYLDDTKEIGTQVSADVEYTVTDIAGGIHTVKVVSLYDGKVSEGIISDEVTVEDYYTYYQTSLREVIQGRHNLVNVNYNNEPKIISTTQLYDESTEEKPVETTYTIEAAQMAAFDGKLPTGESSTQALRTQKGIQPAEVVIDLGVAYTPRQFEKVMLAYSNNRTYAQTTMISFSSDNENYIEVGGSADYKCSIGGGDTVEINEVPIDAEKIDTYLQTENSVRYIKITLSGGSVTWGYVINEIGVIINCDVDESEIFTGKDPIEAPVLESKVYTAEVLVADVEDTDYYTVTANSGGIEAGSYDVELTLTDPEHYRWSDDRKGKETTKTISFEITQADNEWTKELTMESWAYGEEAKTPEAEAKFGEAVYTYSTSEDGEYTPEVPENAGTYFVKAEVAETANYKGLTATAEFTIVKAEQDAPEGIETVASTLETNADGKITNVTDAMEYRAADDEEYKAVEGTEIADVLSGTYYVRYKETENYNASAETEVVVETGRKLAVTLGQGTGYVIEAVTAGVTEVEYGKEYSFKVTINKGYKKDAAFAVKANGEKVEANAEGVYKVVVTADTEITVEGVVADVPQTTAQNPTQKDPTTTPAKKTLGKTTVTTATKKMAAKKVSIKFKKVKGAKKYTVQISATKKFKKVLVKKTVKKVKATITSKKIANKKTLFVRVKAVGAKKWSKVKKIKIKK